MLAPAFRLTDWQNFHMFLFLYQIWFIFVVVKPQLFIFSNTSYRLCSLSRSSILMYISIVLAGVPPASFPASSCLPHQPEQQQQHEHHCHHHHNHYQLQPLPPPLQHAKKLYSLLSGPLLQLPVPRQLSHHHHTQPASNSSTTGTVEPRNKRKKGNKF